MQREKARTKCAAEQTQNSENRETVLARKTNYMREERKAKTQTRQARTILKRAKQRMKEEGGEENRQKEATYSHSIKLKQRNVSFCTGRSTPQDGRGRSGGRRRKMNGINSSCSAGFREMEIKS